MKLILTVFVICNLFIGISHVRALYDPLSVPNNRIGVHILDPSELFPASQLVNSSGGDWGYVTVPIRSDDRDFYKWNEFFKKAGQFHVIPIIRLATYPDGGQWVAPNALDIIDFANFLNLFDWPVKNRYIILFNEPNHAKEWGGQVDPEDYTSLARFSYTTFKAASPDFFLISAGLDMSAPTNHTSIDALQFYLRMFIFDSGWPKYFDGISFHPYPNPAFKASPYTSNRYGIRSFEHEMRFLSRYGFRPGYLFFTETGTVNQGGFYTEALTSVWRNSHIVAITPFVLFAGTGDFQDFSLLTPDHGQTENYRELKNLTKTIGQPPLSTPSAVAVVKDDLSQNPPDQNPVRSFWQTLVDFIVK